MFKIQKSGNNKYLKKLLVALIIVGMLGAFIIPQQSTFAGQGESYDVVYYDYYENEIFSDYVEFGTSVPPPPESAAKVPDDYYFVKWNMDSSFVTGHMYIRPIVEAKFLSEIGLSSMTPSKGGVTPSAGPPPGGFSGIQATSGAAAALPDTFGDLWDLSNFIGGFGSNGEKLQVWDSQTKQPMSLDDEFFYEQSYDFRVTFSSPKYDEFGVQHRMQNDPASQDGYLTYELPAGIVITGSAMTGDLVDRDNTKIGTYTIVPGNPTKVQVQLEKSLVDGSGIASISDVEFWVSFSAKFENNSVESDFYFGENLRITVIPPEPEIVETKSAVTMNKTDYGGVVTDKNTNAKSIHYTITVSATEGTTDVNRVLDQIEYKQFADFESLVSNMTCKLVRNGVSSDLPFDVEFIPVTNVISETAISGGMNIWLDKDNNGITLKQGDQIIIDYNYAVKEENIKAFQMHMWGDIYGYGFNIANLCRLYDDFAADPTTSEKARANVYSYMWRNFSKTAAYEKFQNGDEGVVFEVAVGDGMTNLRGMQLQELLDFTGLESEYLYDILVNYYSEFDMAREGLQGYHQMTNFRTDKMLYEDLFPGGIFTIGSHFAGYGPNVNPDTAGIYYVVLRFKAKIIDDLPKRINNTIRFITKDGEWNAGSGVDRPTPESYKGLEKNGEIIMSGGEYYIDWKIDYLIPKSAYGYPLSFKDTMLLNPTFQEHTKLYAVYSQGNFLDFKVTAAPVTNGVEGSSSLLEPGKDYSFSFTNENRFWELDILDGGSKASPFKEDTMLTITYRIPFDIQLYGKDYSLREAVEQTGADIENWIDVQSIYKHSAVCRIKYPIIKTASKEGYNTVRYTLDINSDGNFNLNDVPPIVYDFYDSKLVYAGKLTVTKCNITTKEAIGRYTYSGTPPTTENGDGTSMMTIDFNDPNWDVTGWFEKDYMYVVGYNLRLKTGEAIGEHMVSNKASFGGFVGSNTAMVGDPVATKKMMAIAGTATASVELVFNEAGNELSKGQVYRAEDRMDPELYFIEDSLTIEVNEDGVWKKITAKPGAFENLGAYEYYISNLRLIYFGIPDKTPVRIKYNVDVLVPPGSTTELSNTIKVLGIEYSAGFDSFAIQQHSGGAKINTQSLTVKKTDSYVGGPIADVPFALYQRASYTGYNPAIWGTHVTEKLIGTDRYYIIGTGVTDASGEIQFQTAGGTLANGLSQYGAIYALFEEAIPKGYETFNNIDEPIVMFSFDQDIVKSNPSLEWYNRSTVYVENAPITTDTKIEGVKRVEGIAGGPGGYAFHLTEVANPMGKAQVTDGVLANYLKSIDKSENYLEATSDAGGAFAFDTIPGLKAKDYRTPNTYYFRISEVKPVPADKSISYAKDKIVEVTVAFDSEGNLGKTVRWFYPTATLEAQPVYISVSENVFLNSIVYKSIKWAPSIMKTVTGKTVTNEVFYFEMIPYILEGGTWKESGEPRQLKSTGSFGSNNNAQVVFDQIEFKAAGNYGFLIHEKIKENSSDTGTEVGNGWTLDERWYFVWALISENVDGSLIVRNVEKEVVDTNKTPWGVIEPSLGHYNHEDPAAWPTFVNTYGAKDTEIDLLGKKIVTGGTLTNELFSFTIMEGANEVASGKNTALGVIAFSTIEYTSAGEHTYVVTEDTPLPSGWSTNDTGKNIYVKVVDDGNGNLVAKAYRNADFTGEIAGNAIVDLLTFENAYTAKETGIDLVGKKSVTGGTLTDEQFSFTIMEGANEVASGKNTALGVIEFSTIEYTSLGEHTYVVTEDTPLPRGWRTNDTGKNIYVKVVDDGNGNLVAKAYRNADFTGEITGNAIVDLLTFSNTYSATGSLELTGTKKVNDGAPDEIFTFTVRETVNGVTREITTGSWPSEGGSLEFKSILYGLDDVGDHIYEISEDAPLPPGWSTSDKPLVIYVRVVDNEDGTLTPTAYEDEDFTKEIADLTTYLTFNNTYTAEGSLKITGNKILGMLLAEPSGSDPYTFEVLGDQSMTEGQFTFSVKELDKIVARGYNDPDGNIIFDTIKYGLADVSDTPYTYVISEDGKNPAWRAFTEPVTIKVLVEDLSKNGILTITVSVYDEETEEFILIENDEGADTQNVGFAIDVENHRLYDAALRKWVSGVNPVNAANIDSEGINNSKDTADGGVKSDPVQVYIGDDVVYTIRVFNQCEWPLRVTGVVDNVPDGLFFDASKNPGWTQEGSDGPITYLFDKELILYPAGSAEGDSTAEITVVLKVMPNVAADELVTNSAMIIGITDDSEIPKPVVDIDSDFEGLEDWKAGDKDNEVDEDGKNGGDRDEHDIAQIYVEGTINVEVYKDTIKITSAAFDGEKANVATEASGIIDNVQKQESYRYDINFRSTSNVDADEFIVEDPLEAVNAGLIRIVDLWTPAVWGDMNGEYDVYYRKNGSDEWIHWATVSDPAWATTGVIGRQKMNMSVLGANDYISGLRFEFGAVKVGFTSRVDGARSMNLSGIDDDIRNTNGSEEYYTPIADLEPRETPDGVPTKGTELDWSLDTIKDYIFYPKNTADLTQLMNAEAAGALKPASYLVVATMSSEEMMARVDELNLKSLMDDNDDIVVVSSAIAYISKDPIEKPWENGGGSDSSEDVMMPAMFAMFDGMLDTGGFARTAGVDELTGIMYDNDQDAVLTRFIIPFMYKEDLGEGRLDYASFEDSDISFAGMHMIDGVWYDNQGRRVQTGDVFAISLWMVLLACAAICFVLLIRTFIVGAGRKKRQENEIVSGTEKGGGM